MKGHLVSSVTPRVNAIIMGEYGTDPDEVLSIMVAAWLIQNGYLQALAFIGNHAPALQRARSAKSTLQNLGLGHIPVGMGEAGFGASNTNCETDPRFLSLPTEIQRGRDLLRWTLEQSDDHSVVLVLNSGFTDAVWLWLDRPDLFLAKVVRVVIMSGIEVEGELPKLDPYGFITPSLGRGGAANNCFDPGATMHLFHALQAHNIPMVITTRAAAYRAKMPYGLFHELAATGHPSGQILNERQVASINELWRKVNAPAGSELRGKLPIDRDKAWFADTFCGGTLPPIKAEDDITPYVLEVTLYDPMNVVAAIPSLLERFYTPFGVKVGSATHQIIGLTPSEHGVSDAEGLRAFMLECLISVLQTGRMAALTA